ncbi:MAG TPA: STAS domain-containing protein [Actinomycetota bacterium]|nr:STAS domain-containing protein [Actinomycetota bacterium]
MDLSIDTRDEAGWTILRAAGEVDLYTAPRLRERLLGAIEGGATRVVVDLVDVSFMDSSGLGVLIGGLRRLRERGGELALVCGEGAVRRVLAITGLDQLFPIHASVERATASAGPG